MGHLKRREPVSRFQIRALDWTGPAFVVVAVLIASLAGTIARAEEHPATTKSPFGIIGGMQSGITAQPASEPTLVTKFIDRAWSWLLFEQHRLTQDMTGAVRDLKSTTSIASATSALVIVSFVYGVLHAVGPGHGKAVISSYMLADKETLRRGIFLAFMSSLIQALSAIGLVGGLYLAAKATGLETRLAEAWLETVSWGCVAILGAWLMIRQTWPVLARQQVKSSSIGDADHVDHTHGVHNHDGQDHHHQPDGQEHHHEIDPAGLAHYHAADCGCSAKSSVETTHFHDENCGHAHLPGPEQLAGDLSWRNAIALALSVGVRPCTGALLVIVFAASQGAIWAGVLATFAMAVGTAITVSALAGVAVGSRNLAIGLAGSGSHWGATISKCAGVASSATVFLLGTALFIASFHNARPF